MDAFLTILILVPSAAVVVAGVLYILGMIAMGTVAGVDALVVAARHHIGHAGRLGHV